jgi:hypothetical protein
MRARARGWSGEGNGEAVHKAVDSLHVIASDNVQAQNDLFHTRGLHQRKV